MLKHFKFYLLFKLVKDPIVSAQIYDMIYHKASAPKKETSKFIEGVVSQVTVPNKTVTVSNNETQSLKEQLNYLKSKSVKSKQDRDSIGILEAVLKNKTH